MVLVGELDQLDARVARLDQLRGQIGDVGAALGERARAGGPEVAEHRAHRDDGPTSATANDALLVRRAVLLDREPHVRATVLTRESPLALVPEFVHTTCPRCGGPARRETDTMGGAACSSWYFLRFADPHNDREFAARHKIDYWLPVDLYVGGAEHAVMHLLYARFWTKVLSDAGYIGFQEPFLKLRNQGQLLAWTPGRRPGYGAPPGPGSGEEAIDDEERIVDWILLKPEERASFPPDQIVWRWARMSKSRYNVITPDEIAEKYGADSLRIYEMFVVPFEETVQWTEEGIKGAFRFLSRIWRWTTGTLSEYDPAWRECRGVEQRKLAGRRGQHAFTGCQR